MNTATQDQKQFPPKHPQFILAADKSFFEGQHPYQKFGHHLHQGITPVEASLFYQAILGRTVLRRRYELDLDTNELPYRQYLPYDVFGRLNRQFKREYFAYRRTPKAGEPELHGKVSIGIGGHIDGHLAIFDDDGVLLLPETVANSAMVERVQELHVYQTVNGEKQELHTGAKIERFSQWVKPSPMVNLLIDNGDNVGQRHFALVNFVNVPIEYELGIAEEELESLGFLTYDELTSKNDDGSAKYNLEGWTKICLEYFEKGARGPVGIEADMSDISRMVQSQNLSGATKQDQQAAIDERRARADQIRSGTYQPAGESVSLDEIKDFDAAQSSDNVGRGLTEAVVHTNPGESTDPDVYRVGTDASATHVDNPDVGEDGVVKGYVPIQEADSTEQFKEAVSTPIPETGDLGANPENQPAGSGSLTLEGKDEEVDTGASGSNEPHGGWLNSGSNMQNLRESVQLTGSNTEDFKDAVNTLLPSTGDLVPDPAHQPGGSGSLTLHNEDADKATADMPGQINTAANVQDNQQAGLPVQDPLVDNDTKTELITDPSTIPTSDKPAE